MRPGMKPDLCLVACVALSLPGTALAGDHAVATAETRSTSIVQPRPAIGQPLDSTALDALRGGESSIQVLTTNDGSVNGNTADGVVSGSNLIGGDAFAGAAGITAVIQNSGSNVLIQNGTAVNVQFVDPTP